MLTITLEKIIDNLHDKNIRTEIINNKKLYVALVRLMRYAPFDASASTWFECASDLLLEMEKQFPEFKNIEISHGVPSEKILGTKFLLRLF